METIDTVGARPLEKSTLDPALQEIVNAVTDVRKQLYQDTLNSNDPKELMELRRRFSDLGDALIAYVCRKDASKLRGDPDLDDLISKLDPLLNGISYADTRRICDMMDTLFKQAPFTPNPSHALLLQKNIA